MPDKKQKLINLVSALETEASIDYFYTFIALKLYGKADCPSGHFAEVCKMWESHMKPGIERHEQERKEQTAEEKQAGEYRHNILGMIYEIKSLAILDYISAIISDVAKEDTGKAEPERR